MSHGQLSDIERSVFGEIAEEQVWSWLGGLVVEQLGAPLDAVLWRSGRLGAVFGLRLQDSRRTVAKVYRDASRQEHLVAAVACQQVLATSGYPAPRPMAGPVIRDGRSTVLEEMLEPGRTVDGRDPAVRNALAASMAAQVVALRPWGPTLGLGLRPPSWACYRDGPWPVPHDAIFDFSRTPPGFSWLDELAATCSALLGQPLPEVIGHSDWNCGNVGFHERVLVAAFDWDSLVADREAVVVGLSAGAFTSGGPGPERSPTPQEVARYVEDYSRAAASPFGPAQRAQAFAAATWVLCYNARCDLSAQFDFGVPATPGSALGLLRAHGGASYLNPTW